MTTEHTVRTEPQSVPVRVYRSENHIMVAAPMPGLEPEDITVTVHGREVGLHGEERGPGQHERDLVQAEWGFGPYHRELRLPEPVDGNLANATYGNGVVVLSLPKAGPETNPERSDFRLRPAGRARGDRTAHAGHDAQPASGGEETA